jgi:hypothetical protein
VAEPGGVGDGASHPSSRILLQGYVYHIYSTTRKIAIKISRYLHLIFDNTLIKVN